MTISLEKGGRISLSKDDGGLGWNAAKAGGLFSAFRSAPDIDLDASCVVFDRSGEAMDIVFFNKLQGFGGAIHHGGDNRTGAGDGDDEQIMIDLTRLPSEVGHLVLTVNSYQGQTFDKIENASCRLVDDTTGKEIAKYVLSDKGSHTGVVMACISREGSGWSMKAIGTVAGGRTAHDLVPYARKAF
jgi:tellurium resistance protein TerZ